MPIQAPQYRIRHLRRHEIEQLLQLCKAEGRQMGTVAEIESWMQIDPRGFFVAVNEQGHIIGSCCGMRLSQIHGYVGMYVVNKNYRGLGIGKQVWNAALNHLGSRNNGLSAVAHLFTLYRDKAGFSHVADWTVDLYKLDNLAVIFHCNKNNSRQTIPCIQTNDYCLTHSLFDHYETDCDCGRLTDQSNNTNNKSLENEFNYCCFAKEFNQRERKYLKPIKANSIEFSDDETYGFSSLFFEERGANDIIELNEETIGQKENELNDVSKECELNRDSLECCIKLAPYCSSSYCNNGKLRTVFIKPENGKMVEDVVEYDRRLNTYDRSQIVRLTLTEKNCIGRVALLGKAVVGYGCVKPNLQNMWIVSPLYADNEYVAQILIQDLVTDVILASQYDAYQGMIPSVVLKAPSNNIHASKLLNNLGFVKQDYSLKRCYTKKVFEVPTQSIYALHTSVFCTE